MGNNIGLDCEREAGICTGSDYMHKCVMIMIMFIKMSI